MTAARLKVTEEQFQRQVVQLARLHGWHVMHVRRSRARHDQWATTTSIAGWPDLFMWHPTQQRRICAELKSATGRLRPEQRDVLATLADAGEETYVWRPNDLDTIAAILSPAGAP